MATSRRIDLTGRRFGRLEVVAFDSVRDEKAYWLCKCECGGDIITSGIRLRNGETQSCGCYHREIIATLGAAKHGLTHGRTRTPEYRAWTDMIHRCHSPTAKAAKYYRDRGIKVCERWRNSFEAFLADMGPRPSPELSIDRTNNDGNYEPGNCRWATKLEQSRNRRCCLTSSKGEARSGS